MHAKRTCRVCLSVCVCVRAREASRRPARGGGGGIQRLGPSPLADKSGASRRMKERPNARPSKGQRRPPPGRGPMGSSPLAAGLGARPPPHKSLLTVERHRSVAPDRATSRNACPPLRAREPVRVEPAGAGGGCKGARAEMRVVCPTRLVRSKCGRSDGPGQLSSRLTTRRGCGKGARAPAALTRSSDTPHVCMRPMRPPKRRTGACGLTLGRTATRRRNGLA